MNAVIVAVLVMLVLSLLRVNVVFALLIGALAGGLSGGLPFMDTIGAFAKPSLVAWPSLFTNFNTPCTSSSGIPVREIATANPPSMA